MPGTTSNPHQKQPNPHFRHIERAPYELGCLLRALPEKIYSPKEQSEDTYLMAEAAGQHASNGLTTLLHGLEALGSLMVTSATNDKFDVSAETARDVGALIQHIAVEIQHLQHVEESMRDLVNYRGQSPEGVTP